MRGIEANIPRTLTKRSHILPLPEGEGGVRGKALFDFSIASPILQVTLPIAPKIARNHSIHPKSAIRNLIPAFRRSEPTFASEEAGRTEFCAASMEIRVLPSAQLWLAMLQGLVRLAA